MKIYQKSMRIRGILNPPPARGRPPPAARPTVRSQTPAPRPQTPAPSPQTKSIHFMSFKGCLFLGVRISIYFTLLYTTFEGLQNTVRIIHTLLIGVNFQKIGLFCSISTVVQGLGFGVWKPRVLGLGIVFWGELNSKPQQDQ